MINSSKKSAGNQSFIIIFSGVLLLVYDNVCWWKTVPVCVYRMSIWLVKCIYNCVVYVHCVKAWRKCKSKSKRGYWVLTSLPNTLLIRTLWHGLNTEVRVAKVAVFELPVILNLSEQFRHLSIFCLNNKPCFFSKGRYLKRHWL